jgi:hypothetical protein
VLLVRTPHQGFMLSDGLPGQDATAVREHVTAAREFFAGHGEPVEWKTYGNDNPELVPALQAAGIVPEPTETVVVASSTTLAVDASADSSPILQRLGMRAVTTTTPWVWVPPSS